MDTANNPDARVVKRLSPDGEHWLYTIESLNGKFTLELLRQLLFAYNALAEDDRQVVDNIIADANKTGVPLHE